MYVVVLQTLPAGLRFECHVALESANKEKNRYKDIYACKPIIRFIKNNNYNRMYRSTMFI